MTGEILVPLDGSRLSESVLPLAVEVARGTDSGLRLLYVHPEMNQLPQVLLENGPLLPAHRYLSTLALSLQAPGFVVNSVVESGPVVEQIEWVAQRQKCHLVALATHGRSGLGRAALGSVADKLIHITTQPLLLWKLEKEAPAHTGIHLRSIVVALDGSALGEAAFAEAQVLARRMKLKLHLVQVAPTAASIAAGVDPYLGYYDPKLFDAIQESAETYLAVKSAAAREQGLEVQTAILSGAVASQLIDYADGLPGSMLAVSTHGRSGLGRWALGSVADRVIRGAHRPVLLVRPQVAR